MLPDFDPDQITHLDDARQALWRLLNLIETLKQENEILHSQVQHLRDEVNRLKGEQGKPDLPGSKRKPGGDHSSERERHRPKRRRKSRKVDKIEVTREETLCVERSQLPEDAQFKGYEAVVVQEIALQTANVRFLKEKFYSASRRQTWLAELPPGYAGEFGPGLRSLVLTLYYGSEVTEPKIVEFLQHLGIFISAGQVSNLLTKDKTVWHAEKEAIYRAGLASSSWQHMDDTRTPVDGENQHCHVVCNPLYSAYFTRPAKDRLTVISLLQHRTEPVYLLNATTTDWLERFASPHWAQQVVASWSQEQTLTQVEMDCLIQSGLKRLNAQQQARIREAAALTAYHQQTDVPHVRTLVSDDAPQFAHVTPHQALCWVHEGRHYKKLTPFVASHRQQLEAFLKQFWDYYHELQAYRRTPSPQQAHALSQTFETLFSQVTGYDELDKRIAQTKAKKERLLKVLQQPEIPLHNNPAELAVRRRVRKRDISFGPRTADGVAAWDTFMTLAATAKQLGVSFYAYIYDRVAAVNALPSLADLIRQRAPAVHLVPVGKPA
jgi:hypothetical protein